MIDEWHLTWWLLCYLQESDSGDEMARRGSNVSKFLLLMPVYDTQTTFQIRLYRIDYAYEPKDYKFRSVWFSLKVFVLYLIFLWAYLTADHWRVRGRRRTSCIESQRHELTSNWRWDSHSEVKLCERCRIYSKLLPSIIFMITIVSSIVDVYFIEVSYRLMFTFGSVLL